MNRPLFILLAIAFLTVAIGAWLVPPAAVGPSATATSRPQQAESTALANKQDRLEDFAALGERPPFSATRRSIRSAEDDSAALVLGRYRLAGVVVAPSTRSVILSGLDNRSLIVAEGETVDGWTVDEITAEKVVFSSDGRRQTFAVEQPGR
jgi:hypothetical protein